MPYKIVKDHPDCPASKPWAVVKEDDGKKIGCNETKKGAEDQITAINISESMGQTALDERSMSMSEVQPTFYTRAMVDLGDTGQRAAKIEELLEDHALPVPFIASTEGVKADGIDLKMEDWDLKRFKRYGPVMWVHDYWHPPLGTGTAKADDKLRMDVLFDRDDDFAMLIRGKAIKGMMAGSVGWFEKKNGKNELIEFSMTPLGLDPDALPDIQRSGLRAVRAEISEILKETDEESTIALINELRDEIMAAMTEALDAVINYDSRQEGEEEELEDPEPETEERDGDLDDVEEEGVDVGEALIMYPRDLPPMPDNSVFMIHNDAIWLATHSMVNNGWEPLSETTAAGTDALWYTTASGTTWADYRTSGFIQPVASVEFPGLQLDLSDDDLTRAGAVLSKKNRDDLTRALELIRGVMDRATPAEEEEPAPVSDEEREEEIETVDTRDASEEHDDADDALPGIVTEIVDILETEVEGD